MPSSLLRCRQSSVKAAFLFIYLCRIENRGSSCKAKCLVPGVLNRRQCLASGGRVFVLGSRAGRAPSTDSEQLRKRLAGKSSVVTQTGESQEIESRDRGCYLNLFWHTESNWEVLTPRPWAVSLQTVLAVRCWAGLQLHSSVQWGQGAARSGASSQR